MTVPLQAGEGLSMCPARCTANPHRGGMGTMGDVSSTSHGVALRLLKQVGVVILNVVKNLQADSPLRSE